MTAGPLYLPDGTRIYAAFHYTGTDCPICGEPMATDGTGFWCSDKPHHMLPVPPQCPQCPHGVVGGAGCEDCAQDDGAGLARGGAS